MSNDNKNDPVRPLDEMAKQMYRDDPGFAMRVEATGYWVGGAFLLACVILCFLFKALG